MEPLDTECTTNSIPKLSPQSKLDFANLVRIKKSYKFINMKMDFVFYYAETEDKEHKNSIYNHL